MISVSWLLLLLFLFLGFHEVLILRLLWFLWDWDLVLRVLKDLHVSVGSSRDKEWHVWSTSLWLQGSCWVLNVQQAVHAFIILWSMSLFNDIQKCSSWVVKINVSVGLSNNNAWTIVEVFNCLNVNSFLSLLLVRETIGSQNYFLLFVIKDTKLTVEMSSQNLGLKLVGVNADNFSLLFDTRIEFMGDLYISWVVIEECDMRGFETNHK